MGEFSQDVRVTPLLFSKYILGFLMTTEDLGLTSHLKDGAFYSLYFTVCTFIFVLTNWKLQQNALINDN